MANIIDQIIQIDSIAQQKLKDAALLKEQYAQDAKRKMADTNALIEQKAQEKVDEIRRSEEWQANQERAEILAQKEEAIVRLERIFAQKREQLEQEIYQNVLGLRG